MGSRHGPTRLRPPSRCSPHVPAYIPPMAKHTIVLIPGDGIGPEVTTAARRVLDAAGFPAEWVVLPAGASALDQGFENVLPQRTVAAITAHKVALKGPVT